jgi:hypothetical protein
MFIFYFLKKKKIPRRNEKSVAEGGESGTPKSALLLLLDKEGQIPFGE